MRPLKAARLPFRFRVLRFASEGELIYLPKLAEGDVDEISSRLRGLGFEGPKVASRRPSMLRYVGESFTLRLMPRGLFLGPRETFNRVGASLALDLAHPSRDRVKPSWSDNDFQLLTPTDGGVVYHSRGRHSPLRKRFAAELSRFGPFMAGDELYMMAATAEACGASAIELLTARPGDLTDLSPPIHIAGGRYLHHVRLPLDTLLSTLQRSLEECLAGTCPVSTLADSTAFLHGATTPSSVRGDFENTISALENWVSDASYFSATKRSG